MAVAGPAAIERAEVDAVVLGRYAGTRSCRGLIPGAFTPVPPPGPEPADAEASLFSAVRAGVRKLTATA